MVCIWRHLGGVYIDYSIIGVNRLFYQTATKRKK
nr:MAG TPA: glycosyltransferase [Caudoviricetes sp.]